MINLTDKTVMVVGTGISGIGAVELLNKIGAKVIIYDSNCNVTNESISEKLNGNKARIVTGSLPEDIISELDLAVISPGVPIDSDIVLRLNQAGVTVWGEIELAYNYEAGTVLAITGTNGKTTTTSLIGQIVGAWNEQTFVVGNIGNSYTKEVLKTTKDSYTVAEISSFQLESIHSFKPAVSAILNITPDHLNRHYTMECYTQTKGRISMNQSAGEVCVLNYDDERLRELAKECQADVVWFSRLKKPSVGAYLDGDIIKYTDGNEIQNVVNVHDIKLIGLHNYENVCAAVAVTMSAGVPVNIITEEIKKFNGVEHRIEYVATKNDVVYYNDSKGTNPDASIKAIESMSRPTILIAGGYDKKIQFDSYIKSFGDKVKLLVLMGETAQDIAETANKYGFNNIIFVDSMEEAVKVCAENAKPNDAVLLSPACASWGMFTDYEQRGNMFKDYVNAL